MLDLHTSVQYVKGIGPKLAEILASKGISTVEDLLFYLPFRYEDRANPRRIGELRPGETASVVGEVRSSMLFRTRRMPLFELIVGDYGVPASAVAASSSSISRGRTGLTAPAGQLPGQMQTGRLGRAKLRCLWFHGAYLQGRFQPGQLVALYGKVEQDKRGGLQIMQPQFEILGEAEGDDGSPEIAESLEIGRVVPVYESAGQGKLTSRWFRKAIRYALENLNPEIADSLPESIRSRHKLIPFRDALWQVHWPTETQELNTLHAARSPAHRRMIFEELFFLELGLELKRRRMRLQTGIAFELNGNVRAAVKRILPFHPTMAQKRVLKEIAEDMQRPAPMRRLLQGDVGSGKTIVALQAAIIAIGNGYQVSLMAPTEILATQHYLSARRLLEPAGYRVVLLTGSLEATRKRDTRRHIAHGNAQLVIGTHALLQEKVEFARLGLVIVDEQHRFGVMQRLQLMKKSKGTSPETPGQKEVSSETPGAASEPDVLVMTATPIPRTLALTLYGDLDVSILDELPPGRTPIVTRRVGDDRSDEVFQFVRKQIGAGHQAYVVYPVIEEGNELDLKPALKMYDQIRRKILPDVRVGLLHGRLDAEEKDRVMREFQKGNVDVLVSTTVIEVGVDVPNATVMVVEHAERFGLAQLHQLRGRIGRGAGKSYCVLMTSGKVSPEGGQRLDAMVRTNNGFEIAELDLEQRGPGEFFGTRQAGIPAFRVANLVRDRELLEMAKREAGAFLAGGGDEAKEEIPRAVHHLRTHWQRKYGLVEVG